MYLRFGGFLGAMLICFCPGADLPTVAHEDAVDSTEGLGLVDLGIGGIRAAVAAAACTGVGCTLGERTDTPPADKVEVLVGRVILGATTMGLSGSGSDLNTDGNDTILYPRFVKPGWIGNVSSKLMRGASLGSRLYGSSAGR